MNDRDESLSHTEREALRALRRSHDPGPALEQRVVDALITRGTVRRTRGRPWLPIVAAVALFVTGVLTGRSLDDPTITDAPAARFMLLLYEDDDFVSSAGHAIEYARWASDLAGQGRHITGAELESTAVTLPTPSPEGSGPAVRGSLAGYFVLGADDLAEAIALTRTSPHLKYGGSIVIRPLR